MELREWPVPCIVLIFCDCFSLCLIRQPDTPQITMCLSKIWCHCMYSYWVNREGPYVILGKHLSAKTELESGRVISPVQSRFSVRRRGTLGEMAPASRAFIWLWYLAWGVVSLCVGRYSYSSPVFEYYHLEKSKFENLVLILNLVVSCIFNFFFFF